METGASTSDNRDTADNNKAGQSSMSIAQPVPMPLRQAININPFSTILFQSNKSIDATDQLKETFKVLTSIDELAEQINPECSTSTHSKSAPNDNHYKFDIYMNSAGRKHARRNALVPYICKIPNERKLRLAASVSNIELLKRLLDDGINPDSFDDHKRTALHLAASRGFKDVVKCLLQHRADPNRQDVLGNTPLHLAVCSASSYNFNMVVRILLEHGARVDIKDRSARTPFDLALSKLCLMRQRLGQEPTIESEKLFVEMAMLTNILQKKLKEQHSKIDFDELENRLRNLSTKEIEVETDNLLGEVAKLSLH